MIITGVKKPYQIERKTGLLPGEKELLSLKMLVIVFIHQVVSIDQRFLGHIKRFGQTERVKAKKLQYHIN